MSQSNIKSTASASSWSVSEKAAKLLRDASVLDLILPWIDYPNCPSDLRYATLHRMKASGYTFVSLTIALDDPSVERVIAALARHRAYFLTHSDRYVLVDTPDDIVRAKRADKLAIGFHFQGTEPVQRDLNLVELYHRLGIRQMLIAYNQKNSAGDGCHEAEDGGLSRFGEALVAEMNRVGIVVDVSHTGYNTSMDTIAASRTPVIFSHSNPRALFDHERNIRDEQIRACAEKGGVVGLNGCGAFLGNNDVSTDVLLRHLDYHVQLVGADHVGIGLDYVYHQDSWHRYITGTSVGLYIEKGGYLPEQEIRYAAPEQMPELVEGMLRLGYADNDVTGVLGGNWMRIMRQIADSADMRASAGAIASAKQGDAA